MLNKLDFYVCLTLVLHTLCGIEKERLREGEGERAITHSLPPSLSLPPSIPLSLSLSYSKDRTMYTFITKSRPAFLERLKSKTIWLYNIFRLCFANNQALKRLNAFLVPFLVIQNDEMLFSCMSMRSLYSKNKETKMIERKGTVHELCMAQTHFLGKRPTVHLHHSSEGAWMLQQILQQILLLMLQHALA